MTKADPAVPALRIPNGHVLALPVPPMLQEFALTGNFRDYQAAGFLGFYDPTTGTGACYYPLHGTWALQQPVLREQFWLHCEVLASLPLSAEAGASPSKPGVMQ